jgi:hypothetical protein
MDERRRLGLPDPADSPVIPLPEDSILIRRPLNQDEITGGSYAQYVGKLRKRRAEERGVGSPDNADGRPKPKP